MKTSKKAFISLSVLFLSILLVCSPLLAAEKEIKIGVIYPLSGALATIGRDLQRAAGFTAESLVNNKNPNVDVLMSKWGGIPNLGNAKIKLTVEQTWPNA
jgi:branched-chain amino acid transport system substrate-binding protein